MNKKYILSLVAVLYCAASATASVNISGTSLLDADTLTAGQIGAYIVSTDGTSFGSLSSLDAGLSISDSSTYGGSFTFFGQNAVESVFGSTSLASGHDVFLTGGVDAGDSFAVLVYGTSTTNTVLGDTYQIWTDSSWLMPADGAFEGFGSNGTFAQLSGVSSHSGTVVPEPSTYAMLSGLCVLGFVALRRRRA
jgi:hypothetical protein